MRHEGRLTRPCQHLAASLGKRWGPPSDRVAGKHRPEVSYEMAEKRHSVPSEHIGLIDAHRRSLGNRQLIRCELNALWRCSGNGYRSGQSRRVRRVIAYPDPRIQELPVHNVEPRRSWRDKKFSLRQGNHGLEVVDSNVEGRRSTSLQLRDVRRALYGVVLNLLRWSH